jgi:heme/copper-type cytochrome/quinol oxidase subunit 4
MLFAAANALLVFIALTCLFAFVRGAAAERIGAAVVLANLLAGMINEATVHDQLVILVLDGLTAVAFLIAALRYASFWLGAVMLLYASQFTLHAAYFILERPRDTLHVILNNVIFFAVGLCLVAGTALAWRRRSRAPVIA